MQRIGKMEIGPLGDREMIIIRPFKAAKSKVWDALTIPALVQKWLGAIEGWTFPVCEIDLRVGGRYRFLWKGPDGTEMGMGGTYQEIVTHEKLVVTERFDEAWYPGDAIVTQSLTESGGTTTLRQTIRYDSTATRDGVLAGPAAGGVAMSFDALEKLVAVP